MGEVELLVRALGHPVRRRLLFLLREREASPREMSAELGAPLSIVSYHTRRLVELGCIELVRTEERRGAIEHYYRATIDTEIDDAAWSDLPVPLRRALVKVTLRDVAADMREAVAAGGFDPPGAYVVRMLISLDDVGWKRFGELAETFIADVRELDAEASPGSSATSEIALLHFVRT